MSSMTTDRLMAQLDGAEMVKYDADGYLLVWFGGQSTGIHVYDGDGQELAYWQLQQGCTLQDVKDSMGEAITNGWNDRY